MNNFWMNLRKLQLIWRKKIKAGGKWKIGEY